MWMLTCSLDELNLSLLVFTIIMSLLFISSVEVGQCWIRDFMKKMLLRENLIAIADKTLQILTHYNHYYIYNHQLIIVLEELE